MYRGNTANQPLSFGSVLGPATRKSCNDGGGLEPEESLTAVRILGRDPAAAIGIKGNTTTEYLADPPAGS
jgi:hypothetical protein